MKTDKLLEILKELEKQRKNKISAIIRDFREAGCTGAAPVNEWGKNPEYPEIYRLECQIDRYKARIIHLKRG